MIVDASIAFKWIAPEEDSALATNLLSTSDVIAPTLLLIEVANGLWKKAVKEQIDNSISFSDEIGNLSRIVKIIDESPYIPRALELGRQLEHAVYDCVYLAMAEGLGDRLVTADAKFLAKLTGTEFAQLVLPLKMAGQQVP
jgi:predicted nucleic acid-binding protein